MALNDGSKNIYREKEEEDECEKDEDEIDEDEPDFMDNSGKCWEFGSKIVDEKHLKEWCKNKMGGMIVGKEEKLTRQFHCPNKECQFKAIFLKSCSIVYTRNEHNHADKNAKNMQQKKDKAYSSSMRDKRGYMDHFGKIWTLQVHISENISNEKLLTQFGFDDIKKNLKTLNLRCTKRNPDGGRCTFAGIYLKTNGFLYTRGQHEHSKRGKKPQNIGDDYVDKFGKLWKFNKEIGKNAKPEIFLNKFGFNNHFKNASGLNLSCKRNVHNRKCKFRGIYLNSNGCLYTRGQHNHEHIEKNLKPKDDDDYVDYFGKVWPFHAKIGKQIPTDEIWLNKFGFNKIQRMQRTVNLYCQKRMINGGKCPFKGIYVKENGCLYIQGKHEHK